MDIKSDYQTLFSKFIISVKKFFFNIVFMWVLIFAFFFTTFFYITTKSIKEEKEKVSYIIKNSPVLVCSSNCGKQCEKGTEYIDYKIVEIENDFYIINNDQYIDIGKLHIVKELE